MARPTGTGQWHWGWMPWWSTGRGNDEKLIYYLKVGVFFVFFFSGLDLLKVSTLKARPDLYIYIILYINIIFEFLYWFIFQKIYIYIFIYVYLDIYQIYIYIISIIYAQSFLPMICWVPFFFCITGCGPRVNRWWRKIQTGLNFGRKNTPVN